MEKVIRRCAANEQSAVEARDWLSATPSERIGAVEVLRSMMYERASEPPRLQRVFAIVERAQGSVSRGGSVRGGGERPATDAFRRRITARIAEVEVPVLGRDDLIRTKRASGRPKDLLDVALLEETIVVEQQK